MPVYTLHRNTFSRALKMMRISCTGALLLCALSSCNGEFADGNRVDPLDRGLNKSYDDMQHEFYGRAYEAKKDASSVAEKNEKNSKASEPPIPDVSPILAAPTPPEVGLEKLVSLSLTEEVPLKDVLMELSRLADMDMEIDPGIKGGVILRVKDKPLNDVLHRIVEQSGLRLRQEKGVLRVERDLPYIKNYSVDFINLVRSNSGSVNISTQVLSAGGSSGGSSSGGGSSGSSGSGGGSSGGSSGSGALSSGSTSAISATSNGDLWTSVENGVKEILAFDATKNLSSESADETTVKASADNTTKGDTSYSINKQAGVISVLANDRQQRDIQAYLDKVRITSSAQVLIEAKVVEVTLNDEYHTGINWSAIDKNLGISTTGKFSSGAGADTVVFNILNKNNTVEDILTLTETFGSSRTLSSPRLHASNNQQAVLTFAKNQVYFTIKLQEQTTQTAAANSPNQNINLESSLNTLPVGIILTLQPAINLDTNEITLNVRPTLSRLVETVKDPGVALIAKRLNADISSEVPVVEVREMDSMVKIKSGQVMVIGGLMEEKVKNSDTGVPFLQRAPIIGNAFKGVSKSNDVVETVIFIKATIVPGYGVREEDQNFYKNFTRDPKPIAF